MGSKPKWLQKSDEPKTTRYRSGKQESRIAKDLGGRTTVNSGATFGENDVTTDFCEVEAKTTTKNRYTLNVAEWAKLKSKTSLGKLPLMVVTFEEVNLDLAVISFDDLKYLIQLANK